MSDMNPYDVGPPLMWVLWYWEIDDDPANVYFSGLNDLVDINDQQYLDWQAARPFHIANRVSTVSDLYEDMYRRNIGLAGNLPEWARKPEEGVPPDIPPPLSMQSQVRDPAQLLADFLKSNPSVMAMLEENKT